MNISVVIPYHRGHLHLVEMFENLFAQLKKEDEVIVVNDHSLNIKALNSSPVFKYFKIVNNNLRFAGNRAHSRNLGAAVASGDILAFFDEDIIVGDGYINYVRHLCEQDKKEIIHSNVFDYQYKNHNVLSSIHPFYEDVVSGIKICPSNNFVMDRGLFYKIGGFDDTFEGWGYEDTDFCIRVYKKGFNIHVTNQVKCFHVKHPVDRKKNFLQAEKNYKHLIQKHPDIHVIYPYEKIMRFYHRSTS